jgi:hypothetical protein
VDLVRDNIDVAIRFATLQMPAPSLARRRSNPLRSAAAEGEAVEAFVAWLRGEVPREFEVGRPRPARRHGPGVQSVRA